MGGVSFFWARYTCRVEEAVALPLLPEPHTLHPAPYTQRERVCVCVNVCVRERE